MTIVATNERTKFLLYEDIRKSGLTNMFDMRKVIELAENTLTPEDIAHIQMNYNELRKKYL